MAKSVKTYLNFIIVGKTGAGKGSTGNTILGRQCFKTTFSFTSCTENVEIHCNEVDQIVFNVVDTPGLLDTKTDMGQIITKIYEGISRIPEGFHAILLVIKLGDRLTKELIETIQVLKALFGVPAFQAFCIIVFTFGDLAQELNNYNIQGWCKNTDNIDPGSELYKLLIECDFRVALFKNNDQSKRDESVNTLLNHLRPGYPIFRNERIQMSADARDDYVTSLGFPEQRARIQTKLSLLEASIDNSLNNNENSDSDGKDLLAADELLETIKIESRGSDLMKDLEVKALKLKSRIQNLPKAGQERTKTLEKLKKKINFMKVSGGAACTFGVVTGGGLGASAALTAVGVISMIPGVGWCIALGVGAVSLVSYGIYALTRRPGPTNKINEKTLDDKRKKKCN